MTERDNQIAQIIEGDWQGLTEKRLKSLLDIVKKGNVVNQETEVVNKLSTEQKEQENIRT